MVNIDIMNNNPELENEEQNSSNSTEKDDF